MYIQVFIGLSFDNYGAQFALNIYVSNDVHNFHIISNLPLIVIYPCLGITPSWNRSSHTIYLYDVLYLRLISRPVLQQPVYYNNPGSVTCPMKTWVVHCLILCKVLLHIVCCFYSVTYACYIFSSYITCKLHACNPYNSFTLLPRHSYDHKDDLSHKGTSGVYQLFLKWTMLDPQEQNMYVIISLFIHTLIINQSVP